MYIDRFLEKELKKYLDKLGSRGDVELRREVKRSAIASKNHYKRNIKDNYIKPLN